MIMSPQEIWDRVNQYVAILNEHGPEGEESKKFVERQEAYDKLLEALDSIRELAVAHGVGPEQKNATGGAPLAAAVNWNGLANFLGRSVSEVRTIELRESGSDQTGHGNAAPDAHKGGDTGR